MNKSDEKFILMSFSAFCVEIRAPAYPSNQEHGSSGNLEHVAGYVNASCTKTCWQFQPAGLVLLFIYVVN